MYLENKAQKHCSQVSFILCHIFVYLKKKARSLLGVCHFVSLFVEGLIYCGSGRLVFLYSCLVYLEANNFHFIGCKRGDRRMKNS